MNLSKSSDTGTRVPTREKHIRPGYINTCILTGVLVGCQTCRGREISCRPCVLNWKQTALHTDWDQNLRDTSNKLVLFINSLLNTHKSICYYKAESMRIISIPSNTKYTGLHKCHIGCKYDFWGKEYHPYMPLIPTNCNLLNILTLSNMKGTIYASKWDQLVNDDICRCSEIQGGQSMSLNSLWIKYNFSQDAFIHHFLTFLHTSYGFLSVFLRNYMWPSTTNLP